MKKHVVVTGISCITSVGENIDELWDSLQNGITGIHNITDDSISHARCQFGGFRKHNFRQMKIKDKNILNNNNKLMLLSLLKAIEHYSMQDDGFTIEDSIYLGNQLQHMDIETLDVIVEHCTKESHMDFELLGSVLNELPPLNGVKLLPTAPSHCIAKHLNLHGEGNISHSGDTSGLFNLLLAAKDIGNGVINRAIVCASSFPFTPHEFLWLSEEGLMRQTNPDEEPDQLMFPFDNRHKGIIYGEGAATIILEAEEQAIKNKREILCHVKGCTSHIFPGETFHSLTSQGFEQNMSETLMDAKIEKEKVDLIFSNACSYSEWDNAELMAIDHLWKGNSVSISNSKAYFGYAGCAAGLIDCVLAVKSMQEKQYLKVKNLEQIDSLSGCTNTDYFKTKNRYNRCLINSAGLGGSYCSVLLENR